MNVATLHSLTPSIQQPTRGKKEHLLIRNYLCEKLAASHFFKFHFQNIFILYVTLEKGHGKGHGKGMFHASDCSLTEAECNSLFHGTQRSHLPLNSTTLYAMTHRLGETVGGMITEQYYLISSAVTDFSDASFAV